MRRIRNASLVDGEVARGMAQVDVFLGDRRFASRASLGEPAFELVVIDQPILDFDLITHALERRAADSNRSTVASVGRRFARRFPAIFRAGDE